MKRPFSPQQLSLTRNILLPQTEMVNTLHKDPSMITVSGELSVVWTLSPTHFPVALWIWCAPQRWKKNPNLKPCWKRGKGKGVRLRETHSRIKKKTQNKNNFERKNFPCCTALCHLTQAVRENAVWLITCHLFPLNSSCLDSRVEQQRSNLRKFTLTWDVRQEQKLEWIQFKEE